jgi:hypothetical protein
VCRRLDEARLLVGEGFRRTLKQPGRKTTERKVGGAYKVTKKASPKKKKSSLIVLDDDEEGSDMEVD